MRRAARLARARRRRPPLRAAARSLPSSAAAERAALPRARLRTSMRPPASGREHGGAAIALCSAAGRGSPRAADWRRRGRRRRVPPARRGARAAQTRAQESDALVRCGADAHARRVAPAGRRLRSRVPGRAPSPARCRGAQVALRPQRASRRRVGRDERRRGLARREVRAARLRRRRRRAAMAWRSRGCPAARPGVSAQRASLSRAAEHASAAACACRAHAAARAHARAASRARRPWLLFGRGRCRHVLPRPRRGRALAHCAARCVTWARARSDSHPAAADARSA